MNQPGLIVLCTGNSCRSQMAEGFLRAKVEDSIPVYSAGTKPAAEVHPLAVRVMAERGIDISGQRPKYVDEFEGKVAIETAIVVCDGANQTCPTWPGADTRLFWPFDDPAGASGSEEERMAVFRRVRDEIEVRIAGWLETRT